MIRYLFFDLDGTLTDPKEGITKSVAYALDKVCGIQVDDLDTLTAYIGPPLVTGFMENHGVDRETALKCQDAYRERFRVVGLFENRLFPDCWPISRHRATSCVPRPPSRRTLRFVFWITLTCPSTSP